MEIRAVTISLFYAFGTLLGGVGGPALFGALIDTGEPQQVMAGYLFGGGLMLAAGLLARLFALPAEGRALEDVAPPLSRILDDAP